MQNGELPPWRPDVKIGWIDRNQICHIDIFFIYDDLLTVCQKIDREEY
jgi:hypothetical protein